MSRSPWGTDNELAEQVGAGAIEFLNQQLADALHLAHRTLDALECPKTELHSAPPPLRRGVERDSRGSRGSTRRPVRGSMRRTGWATPTRRPSRASSHEDAEPSKQRFKLGSLVPFFSRPFTGDSRTQALLGRCGEGEPAPRPAAGRSGATNLSQRPPIGGPAGYGFSTTT